MTFTLKRKREPRREPYITLLVGETETEGEKEAAKRRGKLGGRKKEEGREKLT